MFCEANPSICIKIGALKGQVSVFFFQIKKLADIIFSLCYFLFNFLLKIFIKKALVFNKFYLVDILSIVFSLSFILSYVKIYPKI